MNKAVIIANAEEYVREELGRDSSGHDWWHCYRVVQNARRIAEKEDADLFICSCAAWLHDVADEKLKETKEKGLAKVEAWLVEQQVGEQEASHILEIISTMSYNGGNNPPMRTIEGRIVQDADRLDAIGAIAIARTFAYAGWKGDPIYDPTLLPREHHMTKEEYRNGKSTAVNHFYEKLLKLKDLMNTAYAKEIALERHHFMEEYLNRFFFEWEGRK